MSDRLRPAVSWTHSSYSNNQGACVETAYLPDGSYGVRDSKLGDDSPVLAVPAGQFAALLDSVKADQL